MDMSNKSLALILVVAIVVSLGGTIISLNKLSQLGITGLAPTDTGTANLTISSQIHINFDVNNVNFGSGYIDGGVGTCVLDTNGTSNSSPDNNCAGFTLNPSPFLINNTGNQDVSLELRSSYVASNYTGGTGAEFQWWLDDGPGESATVCDSENPTGFNGWSDVNNTDHTVCTNFNYESDRDTLELHVRVLIPDDATEIGTERKATITATGS